jgi:hypothetical protein
MCLLIRGNLERRKRFGDCMRAFLTACAILIVVSVVAMGLLELVQRPVSAAFATTGARV